MSQQISASGAASADGPCGKHSTEKPAAANSKKHRTAKRSDPIATAVQNIVQLMSPTETERAESQALADYLAAGQASARAQEFASLAATLSALPPDSPMAQKIQARMQRLSDLM